jgi:hypothetical protein
MLFREMITVYSENYKQYMIALFGCYSERFLILNLWVTLITAVVYNITATGGYFLYSICNFLKCVYSNIVIM